MQARIRKDDGLQLVLQEFLRYTRGFIDVAAANAECAIYHRRIVEDEGFFGGRRAIAVQNFHICFQKTSGQISGIGNRRRGANKLRLTSIKACNAPEPAQHIAEMTAENSAIGVQLVDYDVAQILEEPRPPRMMRQYSSVQHVRIGEHDVPLFADGFARVARRVAVISEDAEAVLEPGIQIVQLCKLILRERFGGKQIKRSTVRAFQNCVQDWQVVAERLAGSGWRDHHDIFASMNGFRSGSLMAEELAYAFAGVSLAQIGVCPGREICPLRLASRIVANGGKNFAVNITRGENIEHLMHARDGGRAARRARSAENRLAGGACRANRQRFSHSDNPPTVRLLFAKG